MLEKIKIFILFSAALIAIFFNLAPKAQAAVFMSSWESNIINNTPYVLKNFSVTTDGNGSVNKTIKIKQINDNTVEKSVITFSTDYFGHLSKDINFDLYDKLKKIGSCTLHSGLGSYLNYPDFNGSICKFDNNKQLLMINPSYKLSGDTYKAVYELSNEQHLSRIFVFGDSLSDTGNIHRIYNGLAPKSPPYFHGHFSDGEIWLEYLGHKLNIPKYLVSNYAYGGATISPSWRPIPSLEKQIDQYLRWNPTADSYALYVVWIGSNDFIYGVADNNVDEAVDNAIAIVTKQLNLLIKHGAKNLLIPNLPDFSVSPGVKDIDQQMGNDKFSHKLAELAFKYNTKLLNTIQDLERHNKDVKIIFFDIYGMLHKAIKNYKKFGFRYNNIRCNPNSVTEFTQEVCKNPKEYVFWDAIHPSSHSHYLLGEMVYSRLLFEGFTPNEDKQFIANSVDPTAIRNNEAITQLNNEVSAKSIMAAADLLDPAKMYLH